MKTKENKILLVKDESLIRRGVDEWLSGDGYYIESVDTGKKALERIEKEPYDVVILDLMLPDTDGLHVFKIAKNLRPDIKGVVITAFPSRETYKKGRDLGISDYLPKPFKVDDLEKVINAALGEAGGKEIGKGNLWGAIGALSYQICERNYECGSCPLIQEIQDKFGTIILIDNNEVERLKKKDSGQKFCRFGSAYITKGGNLFLD